MNNSLAVDLSFMEVSVIIMVVAPSIMVEEEDLLVILKFNVRYVLNQDLMLVYDTIDTHPSCLQRTLLTMLLKCGMDIHSLGGISGQIVISSGNIVIINGLHHI